MWAMICGVFFAPTVARHPAYDELRALLLGDTD
jgi:hypothetical protein